MCLTEHILFLRLPLFSHNFWSLMQLSNGSPYATGPLSCLSIMLVYCGQTFRGIKMPLGVEVGLGPGDIVLDGDPAPPSTERGTAALHFSTHVYCGQTVAHLSNYCALVIGSRPSDHYFGSACWFVCLFVQSFSQPSLIRFRSN